MDAPPGSNSSRGGSNGSIGGRDERHDASGTSPSVESSRKNMTTIADSMGLDVPRRSRAVAGHVSGKPGTYRISLTFSEYTGEDAPSDGVSPHVDLFVYDAERPAQHGTPNMVARATTVNGAASLEFTATSGTDGSRDGRTFFVVAKLVNVPGSVNSQDVKAHIELSVEHVTAD